MAFTARVELIGLFRFWPQKRNGEVERIYGLAPWTGPGAPAEEERGAPIESGANEEMLAKTEVEPLHHLVAMWWPRSQNVGVPPSAMTIWPLGGMELTFEFETREHSGFNIDLKSLRLPFMTGEWGNSASQAIVPPELAQSAKLDCDRCLADVGAFELDTSDASRYTDHLGIQKNTANLMGRVVIDRGRIRTDDLTSQESFLSPSLWPDQEYSGYFTNRINVIVKEARAVVMQARNLITGKLAGEVRLATGDEEMLIQVVHLCPEQLLSDCAELPKSAGLERDEDFHRLYDLSEEPMKLKAEMRKRDPERRVTVPTGYFDGHTCRQTRCGSCVG